MADAYLATADIAHFNDNELGFTVSDVLDDAPALQVLAARTVSKDTFKYAKKTVNPSVGFRAVNDGRENAKTTRVTITVTLGVLDATFAVDYAAALADERGPMALVAEEGMDHLKAAFAAAEKQIFHGTVDGDSGGFSGFADDTNMNGASDSQVVDATGTTAGTGSSCYVMQTGPGGVEVVWGQQGVLEVGEMSTVDKAGSATGTFPAWYVPITGWCGLKIGSVKSVVRIANLTEDSGKGLTDDLISSAIAKFPQGSRRPNLIACSGRSLKQLQQSRTATNATGAPAPFPESAFGLPIVGTDQIIDTETLLA